MSPQPAGTTRDQVSETLSVDGLPVKLVDTAGIRATTDVAEVKGVEKSYEALADSDLILVVVDLSENLETADHELLAKAAEGGRCLLVGTRRTCRAKRGWRVGCAIVSALTGEGIDELRRRIRAKPYLHRRFRRSNLRHQPAPRNSARESLERLGKAGEAIPAGVPHEMLLLDLYEALGAIDRITGATSVDDILGNIFLRFCIGK